MAAWLHQDRKRRRLRYFDITAPFEPGATAHGRVPCDLYPAFSEAICRPRGPTDAQVKARVAEQLVPTGDQARTDALLTRGGYTFTFRPPFNGAPRRSRGSQHQGDAARHADPLLRAGSNGHLHVETLTEARDPSTRRRLAEWRSGD